MSSQPVTTTSTATTSSEGQPAVTEETNNSAGNSNSQDFSELPSTLEAALERIKELRSKRDLLLSEKTKSEKEIEKLNKRTRMETLKSLIPRELFTRSDTYEAELEKVYNYKNMSDLDIAEIYQNKLRAIDLGKRVPKQHGSSSMMSSDSSSYAGFRSVPDFHSAATKIQQASSDNAKLFSLMKKIAGSSNNN